MAEEPTKPKSSNSISPVGLIAAIVLVAIIVVSLFVYAFSDIRFGVTQ
jgi:hypothetical protein